MPLQHIQQQGRCSITFTENLSFIILHCLPSVWQQPKVLCAFIPKSVPVLTVSRGLSCRQPLICPPAGTAKWEQESPLLQFPIKLLTETLQKRLIMILFDGKNQHFQQEQCRSGIGRTAQPRAEDVCCSSHQAARISQQHPPPL